MRTLRIALIGDHDPSVTAHRAIPLALGLAAVRAGLRVEPSWLPTASLERGAAAALDGFAGAWCAPGSPYRSEAGALSAIRAAREAGLPFLGTCGGCQHAIIEYARTVLGRADAAHAETDPGAAFPLIAPLACALVEDRGEVLLAEGSRVAALYGRRRIEEAYHCRYGLNPRLEGLLEGSGLRVTGRDLAGEARVLELDGPRFFLLTQFQPERAALSGRLPPVAAAFVDAAAATAS